MATKKTAKAPKLLHVEPAAAAPGADDLEVLHPERRLSIAGVDVVMREYGFIEGLTLLPSLQGFIDDLQELLAGDVLATIDGILPLFAKHKDALLDAMAQAADQPQSWVGGLGMQDGYTLAQLWWMVNGPFFMRTAVNQIRDKRMVAQVRAGQTSTPHLSAQDSATEPPSDA